jgi:transposase-like protein
MENTQRRRTKEEMFPMVELWQHSGLSKKRFCEEKGIVKSVFHYWYKKYRKKMDRAVLSRLYRTHPIRVFKGLP